MLQHGILILGILLRLPICSEPIPTQFSDYGLTPVQVADSRISTAANTAQPEPISANVEVLGELEFPGKGNRKDWEKAGELQDQAVHLEMSSHFDSAIKKAREAIQIYPYDYCFYNTLGIAYISRDDPGDLTLAQQCFETALKLRSDDPMIWDNIARVYEAQHAFTKAKQAWMRCLTLKISHTKVLEVNENIHRCEAACRKTHP